MLLGLYSFTFVNLTIYNGNNLRPLFSVNYGVLVVVLLVLALIFLRKRFSETKKISFREAFIGLKKSVFELKVSSVTLVF